MTKLKVRLTEEQVARYQAAETFWESYAAWDRCLGDERRKADFTAGYITGWERGAIPPLPSENVVTVDF